MVSKRSSNQSMSLDMPAHHGKPDRTKHGTAESAWSDNSITEATLKDGRAPKQPAVAFIGGIAQGCACITPPSHPRAPYHRAPAIAVCAMRSERARSEGPSHRPDYNPLWLPPPLWCVLPDPSGRAYRLLRP